MTGSAPRPSAFIRATIYRPIAVFVTFAALLVVGLVAYPQIPLQLVPNGLTAPSCFLYIAVPDGTPREVMERIAKPCEAQLRTVQGIRRVGSSSSSRDCRIRIEFSPSADPQVVLSEIRDRMDRAKAEWIDGVDRYFLWRQSEGDMPIYVCALSMDVDEEKVDVDYLFDEVITKRMMAVDGVARVNVWGILKRFVEVGLDPEKVDAYGVDLRGLIGRLSADHRTVNAGTIRQGEKELFVRFDNRFRSFDAVLDYPADDRLRVRDFAAVEYNYAVRDQLARANGFRSRSLVIHKESSANTVEVCQRVKAALDTLADDLRLTVPGLTKVERHTWLDQGEMIRFSVDSLARSAMWGGLFAIAVLYVFFRRWGMTLLVTFAIPFSLLITVIWIYFRGGTFNLMSLMGMSLAIGMLVDNSIVVVENIVRHEDRGYAPRPAAIHGVTGVGVAVTLATLTTVMVFLPIFFISDPRFQVIAVEIGEPVCVSVLASLLVALVFIPQGALRLQWRRARKNGAPAAGETTDTRSSRLPWFLRFFTGERVGEPAKINRVSARLTGFCVRHRIETILVAFGLIFLMQVAYESLEKATIQDGPRRLEINVTLPQNSSLREADEIFGKIESALLEQRERLGIQSVTAWYDSARGELNLFPRPEVRKTETEFFAEIRPLVPRLPGVEYRFGFEDFMRETSGKRQRVYIRGDDLDAMDELSRRLRIDLADRERFPEIDEVSEWRRENSDQIEVNIHRRVAQEYGVDTATVSQSVAWALRGAPLPDFAVEEREYPFWVRYGESVKEEIGALDRVRVFREDGEFVRLENVASYAITEGLGEIHRLDGTMTLGFSLRLKKGIKRDEFRKKLDAYLARYPTPPAVELTLDLQRGGFDGDAESASTSALMAFALIFCLMGVLFESFILPLSVLFVVPFALFGSIGLLWVTSTPFDIVGMIGILILVGIVVNNAIVLVDQINRLRRSGVERDAAITDAVRIRFRPIWMTALTTIFGLLPLIVFPQQGEGVDYKPLAMVLSGGLATSTFFTLYMVPVFYTVLDDTRAFCGRLLRSVAWTERGELLNGAEAGGTPPLEGGPRS